MSSPTFRKQKGETQPAVKPAVEPVRGATDKPYPLVKRRFKLLKKVRL